MKQLVFAVVLLTTFLIGGESAQAMQCSQRLVLVGDPSSRVLQLCGEPAQMVDRTETRSRIVQGRAPDGTVITHTVSVTVILQQWTYDFGPQRFMRRLVFEEGVLLRVDTLGYGTVGNSPRK